MIWIPMAVGAGLGLLRSAQQNQQDRKQANIEAVKEQYSPWTGVHGQTTANVDTLGNVLQGTGAGAALGQNMDEQAQSKQLSDAYVAAMNRSGGGVGAGGAVAGAVPPVPPPMAMGYPANPAGATYDPQASAWMQMRGRYRGVGA